MAGILGTGQPGGILGLLAMQQQQAPAPAQYGSDQWAMQTGGPGAALWRELMRAMSTQGVGALAPANAGDQFSQFTRQYLAPQYRGQGGQGQ